MWSDDVCAWRVGLGWYPSGKGGWKEHPTGRMERAAEGGGTHARPPSGSNDAVVGGLLAAWNVRPSVFDCRVCV